MAVCLVLEETVKLSFRVAAPFCILTGNERPGSLHPCLPLVSFRVVVSVVLMGRPWQPATLSITSCPLLATCISSLGERLSMSFAHFLIRLLVF